MKKILILLFLFTLVGCNIMKTPSKKVEEYLDNYTKLSDAVIMDIESTIANESLSSKSKETYKQALKRQYENMKYKIKDEKINGNKAEVIAKISVYDYFRVEEDSLNYMNQHLEEFHDENNLFDNELYNMYRLSELLKTNNSIDYEIKFDLEKKNNEWILKNPDRSTLEKINGFYNYSGN